MSQTNRVTLGKQDPALYKTLLVLLDEAEKSAAAAGVDPLLVELVKIRVSQINGCAYCLRLHINDAIKKGEDADRIATLSAWRETSYFSQMDQAALTLAESITSIADTHVNDDDYSQAALQLTDAQMSSVAWLSIVIEAFNKVAVTSRYPVGPAT